MILQPKGNRDPKERFHVPSGVGKALILTGVVEEFIAHDKLLAQLWVPLKWCVIREGEVGDGCPVIFAKCAMCNRGEYSKSKDGRAHITGAPFNCQHFLGARPPKDVVELYKKVWTIYAKQVAAPRKKFYS